jgi:hypothetical protein
MFEWFKRDKRPSLLGRFEGFEENEVLRIGPQEPIIKSIYFRVDFQLCFCKLGHFSSLGKIVPSYETV